MKIISNIWLVLVLGAAFAMMLGAAQTAWGPKIQANKEAATEQAVYDVVPGAKTIEKKPLELREVYRCVDADGKLVGWGIPTSGYGFADKIYMVVGLSADGQKITGLKVTGNIETPGLGNKIQNDDWRVQFNDLDATRPVAVTKGSADKGKNEIQAITGATISSAAVTTIANKTVAEVRPMLDALR